MHIKMFAAAFAQFYHHKLHNLIWIAADICTQALPLTYIQVVEHVSVLYVVVVFTFILPVDYTTT